MTTIMAISHPMSSSTNGHAALPPAMHTMLSQLSFSTEIPSDQHQSHDQFVSVWPGLFCFSLDEDDQDLFFDAQEDLVEEMSNNDSARGVSTIRGGEMQSNDGTNAHQQETASQQSKGPIIPQQPLPPPLPEDHFAQSIPQQNLLYPGQQAHHNPFSRLVGPPPPQELPVRFLRAGKGDPEEGRRRYEATLHWRRENGIDTILLEPQPNFELIKQHYPHYYHLQGRNGEPLFFEQPPKTNLKAMRDGGVTLNGLLHHYAMVTEFQWQCIERDDFARSITVLDLEGMRMMDFAGEIVEYVRKCSDFTGKNYPERAGYVYVINVPGWFAMIWKVVKPMVDEVTLKKITILRGKKEIFDALLEKIPIENIPPEYGGHSMPLGQSPEEEHLRVMMRHNNALERNDYSCGGRAAYPPCPFCSFAPARSY